jgi:hypothetical protein
MDNRKSKTELEREQQPPIIDGDARPDMPVDTDEAKKRSKDENKDTVTENRSGDINSLEDAKDAR